MLPIFMTDFLSLSILIMGLSLSSILYSLLKLGMAAILQRPRPIYGNFLFHLIL
jgi:hypothetical protein